MPKPRGSTVRPDIGLREFIGLLSATTALTALAIDTMLPAFSDIRQAFGMEAESTRVSLAITVFFIGMASGQFIYGPVSDRFGRKRALVIGLGVYVIGAIGSTLAPTFEFLLASRLLWGLGAAGPRVVTLAILRDRYSGDQMARIMLFVQAVFMLVPILAPVWGLLWLTIGSWRWTFGQAVVLAALVALWSIRLPETLAEENRQSLRVSDIARSVKEILTHRQTVGMAMAQTLMLGSFFPWLGSSELIVSKLYDRGRIYALVFGGMGVMMGISTLITSKAVNHFGSLAIARSVVGVFVIGSALAVGLAVRTDGLPPFALFVMAVALLVSLEVSAGPNIASLALEQMGHIAGIASSVVGTMNLAIGAFLGYLVDSRIEGTVTPLFVGMLVYGSLALVCVLWATAEPRDGRA